MDKTKAGKEISRFIAIVGRGQSEPPELTKNQMKTDIVKTEGGEVVAKRCGDCGELKVKADMSKDSNKKDGMASRCLECTAIKNSKYRKEKPEKFREAQRKWREENPEKVREWNRKWTEENPEKVREIQRKYREENREKKRESSRNSNRKRYAEDPTPFIVRAANRRAMKSALPDTLDYRTEYPETIKFFDGRCALTGDKSHSLEHAVPLSVGHSGTTKENCYPLRKDLNSSKQDRNLFEWFEVHGERYGIDPIKFDRLVRWLAKNHGLTLPQYRAFVQWCHANPRTVEEVREDPRPSIEIWKEHYKKAKAVAV